MKIYIYIYILQYWRIWKLTWWELSFGKSGFEKGITAFMYAGSHVNMYVVQ